MYECKEDTSTVPGAQKGGTVLGIQRGTEGSSRAYITGLPFTVTRCDVSPTGSGISVEFILGS